MKKLRQMLCCLLTACLMMYSFGALATNSAEEDGMLRVYLKSLGEVNTLSLHLAGSYSLNGNVSMRFDRDARLSVSVVEDALYLSVGGFTLGVGENFTLTRHAAEGENGVYIDGSPRNGLYAGDLEFKTQDGFIRCILHIGIEDYLYGVVPYEMSDSFPLEALKAQAVAARTYALQRKSVSSGRDYDVVDTTADQVFFGYHPDFSNAIEAVNQTRGLVGLYQGNYATCYYTASNGGQTMLPADAFDLTNPEKYGYLDVHDDPYDLENPSSQVKSLSIRTDGSGLPQELAGWMKTSVCEELSAMGYDGDVRNIFVDSVLSIEPHSPKFAEPSRMYKSLTVSFTVSACPVSTPQTPTIEDMLRAVINDRPLGEEFRLIIGEPELVDRVFTYELDVYDQLKNQLGLSINGRDYEIVSVDAAYADGGVLEGFILSMRRYGHGVGMSQRGAQWMAGQYGKSCMDILTFYYPGLSFETVDLSVPEIEPLPALSIATPEPLPELNPGEYYATVMLATSFSTLNLRSAPSTDSQVIDALPHRTQVIVVREEGEWCYIRTASQQGYVAASYLTKD